MKTVLIVDDSRTTQLLVRTTLQRLPDTRFISADNGQQALELLGRETVDLIVTDIDMPVMDGVSLVREARKLRTQAQLPILMITAKGEEQARDKGLASGANGYLLKPLSGRDLLSHAARLLQTGEGVVA